MPIGYQLKEKRKKLLFLTIKLVANHHKVKQSDFFLNYQVKKGRNRLIPLSLDPMKHQFKQKRN
jgi:hypothetical protein